MMVHDISLQRPDQNIFCSQDDRKLRKSVVPRHTWPKEIGRPPVPSKANK